MDEPEVALLTKEVLIDKFNHAANYVIFAGMLLVSALIGVFFCIRNVICINFLQYGISVSIGFLSRPKKRNPQQLYILLTLIVRIGGMLRHLLPFTSRIPCCLLV